MSLKPFVVPTGGPVPRQPPARTILRQDSATPQEFDRRKAELEQAQVVFGALVSEVPDPTGLRITQRDYQQATLIAYRSNIRALFGPIRTRWQALGGGDWGRPTTEITDIGDGEGKQVLFDLTDPGPGGGRNAAILWTRITGAHHVTGSIYDKFAKQGGVPAIGYPTDGSNPGARRGAFACRFKRVFVNDAESAILAERNQPEAWWVTGGIYGFWSAMGAENSVLGYPSSDELGHPPVPGGDVRQYFENGVVVWNPAIGPYVEMQPYHIRFRGFHVVRSGGDGVLDPNVEFYFFVSAAPRVFAGESRTTKLPVGNAEYANLRTGRWRHEDVVVYSGRSDSVALAISGAERDRGDPDLHRKAIEDGFNNAIKEGAAALGSLLGKPGETLGKVIGEPMGAIFGKELGQAVNDALSTGDDALDPVAVPLNLATLTEYLLSSPVDAAAMDADGAPAAPIPHHFVVDMAGDGHALQLFFEVRRGAA